jgi:hypothetical protein
MLRASALTRGIRPPEHPTFLLFSGGCMPLVSAPARNMVTCNGYAKVIGKTKMIMISFVCVLMLCTQVNIMFLMLL